MTFCTDERTKSKNIGLPSEILFRESFNRYPYVMFPEEWFNRTIRVEAKKRGVGTDECCEQIIQEYFKP